MQPVAAVPAITRNQNAACSRQSPVASRGHSVTESGSQRPPTHPQIRPHMCPTTSCIPMPIPIPRPCVYVHFWPAGHHLRLPLTRAGNSPAGQTVDDDGRRWQPPDVARRTPDTGPGEAVQQGEALSPRPQG